MCANVEIKFLKLFIAFIFSLLCSRDDDQSDTFKYLVTLTKNVNENVKMCT